MLSKANCYSVIVKPQVQVKEDLALVKEDPSSSQGGPSSSQGGPSSCQSEHGEATQEQKLEYF